MIKVITHTKNRVRAFTLIEVMLAMAVFAIAGTALLGVATNNSRSLAHLEKNIIANWVAANQLVDASLDKSWPPKNNQKGKVEMAGAEWHWRQKVIKTTDNNMRAVNIEVRLDEKEPLAISNLMTYLAQTKKVKS
jgi:general secretion pathway protein I